LGYGAGLPLEVSRNLFVLEIEGQAADTERLPISEFSSVSPEFFQVLKTPVIRGRTFTEADNNKGQPVVIINETLARRYWRGEDPVGKRVKFGQGQAFNRPWMAIVGVVGDIKSDGFDASSDSILYTPSNQRPSYASVLYMRTAVDPAIVGEAIRREVQAVDPNIPVFDVRTMEDVVAKYLAERRFALELLGVFAGVAMLLASIGIYGVMAYTFSQRTNEIGIRMAMGAQPRDILRIAVGEGAAVVAVGVACGLIGSAILTRFLQSMLFGVKSTDPMTFATIAALLTVVTLLACLVPAHKATRVDPLIALRHE